MLAQSTFAGLTLLQIALVSLGLLIIMMNVWSGWQHGVVRQVLRIFAIVAAYIVGYKAGPLLATVVPQIAVLGSVQPAAVSIATGFLTYLILRFLINVLFRRTRDQESAILRFIYGIGGATIGLFFSVIFLIATIAGIRLMGTVADAQFRVAQKRREPLPDSPRVTAMTQLSKAREAIENGPIAAVVETIDPTPSGIYEGIDRVSMLTSDPEAMRRFVSYSGTRELMEHPSLKAVAQDPAIQVMAQRKDYMALMQDPKVGDMLKDESLQAKLKTFEFNKAMDFALKPGSAAPASPQPLYPPPAPIRPARTY
jgi:uncharacterized membrane protein required for colicin V production